MCCGIEATGHSFELKRMQWEERNQGAAPLRRRGCVDRMRRVTDYIAANIEKELSIADLASVACLSPFHFSRKFKDATDKTPHAYVSERRLDQAKQMLTAATIPLAEVALRSGFAGQSSFNKAFVRATGLTPGQYRASSAHHAVQEPARRLQPAANDVPISVVDVPSSVRSVGDREDDGSPAFHGLPTSA
jgi:AraC-like DNA-binding protein